MTLHFSRLTLNRAAPAWALAPLLDPQDRNRAADAHHRLIWTAFSDGADRERDFLWRADGNGRFFTLSRRPPIPNDLFAPPETKPFAPALRPGDRLAYTLRANATRDRPRGELGEQDEHRRVDVVMDLMFKSGIRSERALHREAKAQEAATAWMVRQGAAKGFEPLQTGVEGYHTLDIGGRRRRARFGILDLAGTLQVTEPETFIAGLASGFGRAKAWGFGLMLIRRET